MNIWYYCYISKTMNCFENDVIEKYYTLKNKVDLQRKGCL